MRVVVTKESKDVKNVKKNVLKEGKKKVHKHEWHKRSSQRETNTKEKRRYCWSTENFKQNNMTAAGVTSKKRGAKRSQEQTERDSELKNM